MTEDYLGGKVKFNKAEKHFVSETQEKIEKLDFRGALLRTWIPIKNLNQAIDQQKPWELAKSDKPDDKIKLEDLLTEGTADLYNIAIALQPFMPKKSQEILTILTADKIVKPSTPLFERLK